MGLQSATFAAFVAATGLTLGLAPPALAQNGNRLGEALLGQKGPAASAPPVVARYIAEQGPSFILDRSSPIPLLRFENSREVWVLKPQTNPGGGVLYYNDLGMPVVRITRLGGLTLYTEARPQGIAATLSGPATAIEPFQLLAGDVPRQRLTQYNRRMAKAAQRSVELQALAVGMVPVSMAVDAAGLIADTFESAAARPGGPEVLAAIHTVTIHTVTTGSTTVTLKNGVLAITLRPDQGPAGRPSSRRVMVTLMGR